MHVPSIEPRRSEARPWGLAPGELAGIRLVPRSAPLAGTVFKGTMLMLLTLGLYRFWYRTRLRQYYWQNTRLLDDGFEYTGTGRELFVGFLIAIAILLPLQFGATIATLALGPVEGQAVGVLVFFLVIPALVQIALYRARRYRLSRTRYRGVRFSQSGTGRAYLWTSMKWMLLVALTLGIAFPRMRTALYRYRTEHTAFGNVQATFDGDSKPLMKRWLAIWACIVGGFAIFVIAGISTAIGFHGWVVAESFLGLGILAAVPVLWQVYKVAEFRHFTNHTSFGPMRLACDLAARSVIWVVVKFILMLIAAMILVGVVSGFSIVGLGELSSVLTSDKDMTDNAFSALMGIGLILINLFLVYSLLSELYLRHRLWGLFVSSVSIANTAALRNILQQEGLDATAFGEAFDGGFEIAG